MDQSDPPQPSAIMDFVGDRLEPEKIVALFTSAIPAFQTTSNIPLNERDCETVSAKRAISGDRRCSGMVGINS